MPVVHLHKQIKTTKMTVFSIAITVNIEICCYLNCVVKYSQSPSYIQLMLHDYKTVKQDAAKKSWLGEFSSLLRTEVTKKQGRGFGLLESISADSLSVAIFTLEASNRMPRTAWHKSMLRTL